MDVNLTDLARHTRETVAAIAEGDVVLVYRAAKGKPGADGERERELVAVMLSPTAYKVVKRALSNAAHGIDYADGDALTALSFLEDEEDCNE